MFDKLMWLTLMSPWNEAEAAETSAGQGAPKRKRTARAPGRRAAQAVPHEAKVPKRFRNL